MEITKVIGGSPTTIKGLLVGGSGKCFIIPPFQRNYSWEIKQCKELYEDLILSAENKKPHYLGNIITYSGKNNYSSFVERILVDGQQRITTLLLLICAIKDSITDEEIKEDLLNNYLQNVGKNEKRVRLKQVVGDVEVFESIINNNIESLSEKQKGNKLVTNYNIFVSYLAKEKRVDIIRDLLEAIVNTEIMDIVLIDENNLNAVQVIFEKINSTGKPLTSGDLIRNYLLFANSADEQDKLYEQYWLSIEKNIKDITKFSKVHYVLDTLEYFDENDIYSTFKEYYDSIKIDHKDILNNMKRESLFFSMIEDNNIENESIKRNIKYLKKLKYDDLLPLLVYLYMELLQSNINELDKIIDLLVDFMFRYRIVKPYTGGGPLKKLVLNILTKLKNNEIELLYDTILYELSNSSESNQRFPNDEEFKQALINGDKDEYKREILLRLEDKETKNIKIDVEDKDLTLEHLMPKTKTHWWIKNMGGKEKYQLALQNYLKSIGNLAILSRGYNSVNSNDPWNDKLVQLSTAQFKVTQEVSKNKNWRQQEIISRNEKISKRLCKTIKSPLPRERDVDFIKNNDGNLSDFESGVYDIFDTEFPDSHIAIVEVQIDNKSIKVSSWRELFNIICKYMMDDNKNLFESIVLNNIIHKSKSSKGLNQKDPIITKQPNLLQKSLKIDNTEFYTEAVLSQSSVLRYSRQLIEIMNYDKKIMLVLEG